MLLLFYLLILSMSRKAFYQSTILFLVAMVWTDFIVDEYIGMNLHCFTWICQIFSIRTNLQIISSHCQEARYYRKYIHVNNKDSISRVLLDYAHKYRLL